MILRNESDLARIRSAISHLDHDDEALPTSSSADDEVPRRRKPKPGCVVALHLGRRIVARLDCATPALAFDALRICAGIRFRRESMAETMALAT